MLSFSWSVFSCIRNEYGDLRTKSLYSVQIQENAGQKKLRIWTIFTKWYCQTLLIQNFFSRYLMVERFGTTEKQMLTLSQIL